MQFSHTSVFSDLCNVQNSVTQIIYLWPLPTGPYQDVVDLLGSTRSYPSRGTSPIIPLEPYMSEVEVGHAPYLHLPIKA